MDLFTHYFLLAIGMFFASTFFVMLKRYTHPTNKKLAPKAKGSWPIIGHLPLLSSSPLPHRVLATMADEYGPIFRINLGVNQALVISSWKMAKECLQTNDKAILGRGNLVGIELMGYNFAIFGFTPYGPYWRHMRKIVVHDLLSNHNVLSNVIESEVRKSLRNMYDQWKKNNKKVAVLVDLTNVFAELTLNLTVRIISGKQFNEGNGKDNDKSLRAQKAIRGFFEHMGCFAIGDALPFLRWMDLGGQEKAMKKCFKELDLILQGWLDEHKEKRCNKNHVDQDFIDILLSVLEHNAPMAMDTTYDINTIVKSTCLSLLLGGSDSNKVALTWAFSLLMNNPNVMKRAKEELNVQIGKERQVSIGDISKLVYLGAIVKETLRLYPPGPLMAPREFIEDCIIDDYYVNKGTKLIVNLSKICRDPQVWEDPLEFRPERFLKVHKHVDVKGHHFELIPFGAGRRICPGISFALQVVHLSLATFLHAFEFSTQDDVPVDFGESFGLSSKKTKPLQVFLNPSVSSKAYASN